jgi:hypothetical protein
VTNLTKENVIGSHNHQFLLFLQVENMVNVCLAS